MNMTPDNGSYEKEQFLSQLRHNLRKLPKEELESAVLYYEEYLAEAEEENWEQALAALGSPWDIAVQILADRSMKDIDENPPSTKKGISAVWLVILGIFSLPITLPLAAVFVAVMVVIVMTVILILVAFIAAVFAVIAAFAAVCIALILGGVFYICLSFPTLFQSVSTGFFFFGVGLLAFGLGMLLVPCVVWTAKWVWHGAVVLFGRLLPRAVSKLIPRRV